MNDEKLNAAIKLGEGCRLISYQDSLGIWTAGDGRNLQNMRISQELADAWLKEDIAAAEDAARRLPEWPMLDTDARQNAMIEMCFNLGPVRLRGFTKMREAIQAKNWTEAAKQALDSVWATQVGKRAVRIIAMLQTGQFPPQE